MSTYACFKLTLRSLSINLTLVIISSGDAFNISSGNGSSFGGSGTAAAAAAVVELDPIELISLSPSIFESDLDSLSLLWWCGR